MDYFCIFSHIKRENEMLSVSYYPIVFRKWSVIKTIQAYILGGAEGIIFEHLFYFFSRQEV